MDCSAVHIFLCLLIARTACGPVSKAGAVNDTFREMRKEIQSTLEHLNEPGLLPTNSCHSLNRTGPPRSEQQPLAAVDLPSLRCHMTELSALTPELSEHLKKIGQSAQDVERLINGTIGHQTCNLPAFEQDMDAYVYVGCLLQRLDQKIIKVFDFPA